MTTVIFVHGIGVRGTAYAGMLGQIERTLQTRRPDVRVHPCCWGEELGARLRSGGVSLPLEDTLRSVRSVATVGGASRAAGPRSDEALSLALWGRLYEEPLYELRTLALTQSGHPAAVGRRPPGQRLDALVRGLDPSPALRARLDAAGIGRVFGPARQDVVDSPAYTEAVAGAPEELEAHRQAVARAIVAQAMARCEREDVYGYSRDTCNSRPQRQTHQTRAVGGA